MGDLLLVAGDGKFLAHELTGRDVVIGRDETCDVAIDHRSVSRRHAVFRPGPAATVQDLGSTNGTCVGGDVRRGGEPIALAPGDGFRIGPFSFVVVLRSRGDWAASTTGRDLLRVLDPTPTGVPRPVRDFAANAASVLILGETGVGKEVLASTIHALSGRSGALTRINCAALNENLLESELFGHENGAFTGAAGQTIGLIEAAQGGTVLLDEIGEMPLGVQAKLLRAVEHREITRVGATRPTSIDVRFVSATHRDLPAEVAAGRFRRDLYFRLDGVTLLIPPLRERRGMIGPLAMRFFAEAQTDTGVQPGLGAELLAALEAYDWPGNVRELKAVVERAVVLAGGGDVGVRHLTFTRRISGLVAGEPAPAPTAPRTSPPPEPPAASVPSPTAPARATWIAPPSGAAPSGVVDFLDEEQRADRDRVVRALEECAGNQTRAAKMLGMSRTAFVTKLRIYRVPRPRS